MWNQFTWFDFSVGVVYCFLAILIGDLLKKNQHLVTPFIFGLMYSNYLYQVMHFW